ncbi:MAG: hypothetical protein ACLR1V_06790 [Coprococcus sp.]
MWTRSSQCCRSCLQYGVTPEMLRKRSMEMGTESVLYAKLQDITVIYEAFL